jgi:spore germination protein KC
MSFLKLLLELFARGGRKTIICITDRGKKTISLLLISLLLLTAAGCWDREELEELAYVLAIGIDYLPVEKKIEITTSIIRPVGMAGGGQGAAGGETENFRLVTTQALTLAGALEQQNALLARRVFFTHNEVIIFGENIASAGLALIMDSLARERDVRLTADLYVTDEDIKEVLRAGAKLERGVPLFLRQLEQKRGQMSLAPKVDLRSFIRDQLSGGKDPVMPLLTTRSEIPISPQELKLAGEVSPAAPERAKTAGMVIYPKVSGTAVFREDQLAGYLDEEETKGLLYIKNEILRGQEIIADPFGNPGQVILTSLRSSTKIVPLWQDGSPAARIEVKVEGDLDSQTSASDLSSDAALAKMQKQAAASVEGHILRALRKSRNWGADIFGIGLEFQRRLPGHWKEIEKDWKNIYPEVKVKVKVDYKIRRTGLVTKAPYYEDRIDAKKPEGIKP